MHSMKWDLFCKVIDNWGDIGVCWRLAADLRARGHGVRLWVDEPEAMVWMAPNALVSCQGLNIASSLALKPDGGAIKRHFRPDTTLGVYRWDEHTVWPEPGDVVIEAFGCDPSPEFVRRMAAQTTPPMWVNLEYLTAEPYAQRSHGLRSPQHGIGQGLNKYFFFPGWSKGTGGLIREANLAKRQAQFAPLDWLAEQGIEPAPTERLVSLFCYRNSALPSLLQALKKQPTLLLVTAGQSSEQVRSLVGATTQIGALRVAYLPPLTQIDFDHLLWASDVNLVRGEDSFVRAQFAGKPFLWQIYPQSDGAHKVKLEAFHRLWSDTLGEPPSFMNLNEAWNGFYFDGTETPLHWPEASAEWQAWCDHCAAWAAHVRTLTDLSTQLIEFATAHKRADEDKI